MLQDCTSMEHEADHRSGAYNNKSVRWYRNELEFDESSDG